MPETFADNIKQIRQETAARMVVVGEVHSDINTVQHMRDSLPALKAQGTNTLYIEVPAEYQPLIDKALQGDAKSQRDLNLKYHKWFDYGGPEGAQQRYDLIFDANKAGIRVKAVDADIFNDAAQKHIGFGKKDFRTKASDGMEERLAISNPVIARNIKQMDDGRGAILLIGKIHTFNAGEGDHIETVGSEEYKAYKSAHGGVDAQLRALGIPTASADFDHRKDNGFSLEKRSSDQSADYFLNAPREKPTDGIPLNNSIIFRSSWERMATVLERTGIQAEANGNMSAGKICQDAADKISALPALLDNSQFLKKSSAEQQTALLHAIADTRKSVDGAFESIPEIFEIQIVDYMSNRALLGGLKKEDQQMLAETIISDNRDLHLSGAEKMWKRDPMPLAGEKSGLTKNFDQALASKTPLDRPEQTLPQAASPAMAVRTYDR